MDIQITDSCIMKPDSSPRGAGPTPTHEAYSELQQAYDFFNMRLFDGVLPACAAAEEVPA